MAKVMPTCLALVLCERVRRVRSGEPTIERAIEFFEVAEFPTWAPPVAVWMQFRDGHGPTELSLIVEFISPEQPDPEEIAAATFTLKFKDPNLVHEHEARLDGLPLGREGRYRLRVTASGKTIMQRYFAAYRKEAGR